MRPLLTFLSLPLLINALPTPPETAPPPRHPIPSLDQNRHYTLQPSDNSLSIHAGTNHQTTLNIFSLDTPNSILTISSETNAYDPTPAASKLDLGALILSTYIHETKQDVKALKGVRFEKIKPQLVKTAIDKAIAAGDPRRLEATVRKVDAGYQILVEGNEYGKVITAMLGGYQGMEGREIMSVDVSRKEEGYSMTFHLGPEGQRDARVELVRRFVMNPGGVIA